jgi:hypothetical protein
MRQDGSGVNPTFTVKMLMSGRCQPFSALFATEKIGHSKSIDPCYLIPVFVSQIIGMPTNNGNCIMTAKMLMKPLANVHD